MAQSAANKALRPTKKNTLQLRVDFAKGLKVADEAPALDAEGAQLMCKVLAEACEVLPASEAREVMSVIFTHYLEPDEDEDEEKEGNPDERDAKKAAGGSTLPKLALTHFCEALLASDTSLNTNLHGPDVDGARCAINALFKIMATTGEQHPNACLPLGELVLDPLFDDFVRVSDPQDPDSANQVLEVMQVLMSGESPPLDAAALSSKLDARVGHHAEDAHTMKEQRRGVLHAKPVFQTFQSDKIGPPPVPPA